MRSLILGARIPLWTRQDAGLWILHVNSGSNNQTFGRMILMRIRNLCWKHTVGPAVYRSIIPLSTLEINRKQ